MVKKMKLDFSKVEERSSINTKRMPEGLHRFKVVSVEDKEAQDSTPMWLFILQPTEEKYRTRRFPYYCKLQPNQLWKVRDLFVAAGLPVPKRVGMIDPEKAVGKEVAGEVTDATGQYEGRSELDGIYGLDVLDDLDDVEPEDDEEDEEEWAEDEADDESDEDDEEFDEDEDDEDEEDEDEDDDLDDEDLEDDEDDFDDEDDEEEDEEEEEPAPRRRAPAKKAPAKKAAPAKKPAAKAAPKRTVKRR